MDMVMTDQTVDLTFLGEQMKFLQAQGRHMAADMTVVREKVVLVEAEQVEMRENLIAATGEITMRMTRMEKRFAGLELLVGGASTRIDGLSARVDNYEAASTVRFNKSQQMAATNLEIVLTMIKSLGATATEHGTELKEQRGTLKEQGATLKVHTAILLENGAALKELGATLKNLDRKFDKFAAERKSLEPPACECCLKAALPYPCGLFLVEICDRRPRLKFKSRERS
jgi:hypothetical protein